MNIPKKARPLIVGCEGYSLTQAEKIFLSTTKNPPMGLILFNRNCQNYQQLKALVKEIRECLEWEAPIMIDQEGGDNQRLYQDENTPIIGEERTPHLKSACNQEEWPPFPSINKIGELFSKGSIKGLEVSYWMGLALATQLYDLGININLSPNLDLLIQGSHSVIHRRAFHQNSLVVASLGQQMIQAHLDSGILPCMKHLPGHGKATQDSHYSCPSIDETKEKLFFEDLYPFRANADCPFSMIAHVHYPEVDSLPATQSPKIIRLLKEEVGISGLLITDCIFMKALKGTLIERALACHQAGVDIVLSSHGSVEEDLALCDALPSINDKIRDKYTNYSEQAAKSRQHTLDYTQLPLADYLEIYRLFQSKLS